jgi:hypothetical protein
VLVRIDCLAAVGETNHRTRLKNALDGLEFSRGGFLEAVQQVLPLLLDQSYRKGHMMCRVYR